MSDISLERQIMNTVRELLQDAGMWSIQTEYYKTDTPYVVLVRNRSGAKVVILNSELTVGMIGFHDGEYRAYAWDLTREEWYSID